MLNLILILYHHNVVTNLSIKHPYSRQHYSFPFNSWSTGLHLTYLMYYQSCITNKANYIITSKHTTWHDELNLQAIMDKDHISWSYTITQCRLIRKVKIIIKIHITNQLPIHATHLIFLIFELIFLKMIVW